MQIAKIPRMKFVRNLKFSRAEIPEPWYTIPNIRRFINKNKLHVELDVSTKTNFKYPNFPPELIPRFLQIRNSLHSKLDNLKVFIWCSLFMGKSSSDEGEGKLRAARLNYSLQLRSSIISFERKT